MKDGGSGEFDKFLWRHLNEIRRSNLARQAQARREIRELWKRPFRLFRYICLLAQCTGEESYQALIAAHDELSCQTRSSYVPGAPCDHTILTEVLHSLLATACIASQEIDHAIGSGYDAESRIILRSVHEALVFAGVIERSDPLQASVRYYDYSVVKYYRRYAARSQWREAPEWFQYRDSGSLNASHIRIIQKLGSRSGDYEWARSDQGVNPKGRIRLEDLELYAGLTHRQALYKILCEAVHVSPLEALTNWRAQVDTGYGFVPSTSEELIFATIPEVLLATACMLQDISAIVGRHWELTIGGTIADILEGTMAKYVGALKLIIENCYKTAWTYTGEPRDFELRIVN